MEQQYNLIGDGYNGTRCADPYITGRLLHLLKPRKQGLYLDLGCGTGNYTLALENAGLQLYGAEPSEKMLQEARARSNSITWLKGTAENIPATGKLFDGVIATLSIHHWDNLSQAFSEMARVTKDSARIVLFSATPKQMEGYWLNHYFPTMLQASINQMPSLKAIEDAASFAGLRITSTEKYFVRNEQEDHFLYSGKDRPELYFREDIRRGISSFAALANVEEVHRGLEKLRSDIDDHSFEAVKSKYSNELGDYMFIVLEKEGIQF